MIIDSKGTIIAERSRFLGKGRGSNNVAEYEGVILLIETAIDLGVKHLEIFTDSQLIENQIKEEWKCKDPILDRLRIKAINLSLAFESVSIEWTPRENNKRADHLCTQRLDAEVPKRKSSNPFIKTPSQ